MGRQYWEVTRSILQSPEQPIVIRPKLTEAYLTRPPFKYLHAIFTEVQNRTGFAKGLYDAFELSSSNIHNKEQKVTYLIKMMNVVSLVLGEVVPCDPYKVVSGLEPEGTNIFLQMLGTACTQGDAREAVQVVLQKERNSRASPALMCLKDSSKASCHQGCEQCSRDHTSWTGCNMHQVPGLLPVRCEVRSCSEPSSLRATEVRGAAVVYTSFLLPTATSKDGLPTPCSRERPHMSSGCLGSMSSSVVSLRGLRILRSGSVHPVDSNLEALRIDSGECSVDAKTSSNEPVKNEEIGDAATNMSLEKTSHSATHARSDDLEGQSDKREGALGLPEPVKKGLWRRMGSSRVQTSVQNNVQLIKS
ncbi:hypothetical protein CEUSTIGMA_g4005.t1 [Chlamydomonas eustigma]|uniref:TRAF3-interacting protein 1 n=1 Tax=Chlamydomonas eustigma TaxID=1157962 RepID=A0A250X0V4_9CHLO|nr:hypothetical protein CEUSTIGMA_g4005.t1 [Chlamydomonas eustigma]|eukprot:GAX76559.1 hypothetical protein CEUSTIGMA_g4005.t1 [Chlamydomonas eustigma]